MEQGLGKYADPEFVRYTSREMQEALDMTREEMDRAAHQLLLQERRGQTLTYQLQQATGANNLTLPPLDAHQQSWNLTSSPVNEQQESTVGYKPLTDALPIQQ